VKVTISSEPLRVLLLGRPECGLCEEFEAELIAHADFAAIHLDHADVDSNAQWQRRYGLRIPVLLDGWGDVVCEGRFDAAAFAAWQRDVRRGR
jgi:hypothetical protein